MTQTTLMSMRKVTDSNLLILLVYSPLHVRYITANQTKLLLKTRQLTWPLLTSSAMRASRIFFCRMEICTCQSCTSLQCAGSQLGSPVLGICLIHLSKSLRWISTGCQVPVVAAILWKEEEENESGKAGVIITGRKRLVCSDIRQKNCNEAKPFSEPSFMWELPVAERTHWTRLS